MKIGEWLKYQLTVSRAPWMSAEAVLIDQDAILNDWQRDHNAQQAEIAAITNEQDNSRELLTQVITAVFEKDNATASGDFLLADAAHLRLLVAAQEAYDYLYRENG